MPKNFYNDRPEIPFHRSTVEMGTVIAYLQLLAVPVAIKRSAYVVFRMLSNDGKFGINNNFILARADIQRLDPKYDNDIQSVVKKDNHYFLSFKSFSGSIDMLCDWIKQSGLYIGGQTHVFTKEIVADQDELSVSYYKWVHNNKDYNPTPEQKYKFFSMYNQAINLFN